MDKISERIKKIRGYLGLTQADFGARIGLTQNSITGYESGRRMPSEQAIKSICREFKIDEQWLKNGGSEEILFAPDPTAELDNLAKQYGLSHGDYVFIELLMKNRPMLKKMEEMCMEFARIIMSDDVPMETPAFPGAVQEKENEYKKMISNSAPSTGSTVSNITDDIDEEKEA